MRRLGIRLIQIWVMTCIAMPMEFGDKVVEQKKVGLLRRFLHLLVQIFWSPKGDQGGWEGCERGL
jgi:hypothetical protein